MKTYLEIKQQAYEANMQLPKLDLVKFTFGNVSAADHEKGVFAIKPSGVPYEELTVEMMVVVDFDRPEVGGISHTHSTYATAWSQSQRNVPIYGTTHADHAAFDIPCAPTMSDQMIAGDYEYQTGFQIINCMKDKNLKYQEVEMMLLANHAPFSWGKNAEKAVYNSAVLEEIAKMAFLTEQINPQVPKLKPALVEKHYQRKHGPDSYYGQQ